jgi:hypothetical protein
MEQIMENIEIAQKLFNDKFRVSFGFDGEETVDSNKPGEFRRAVGWGGEESTFTWKRFITLEDNYNPYPGELNPWSLKKWYQWGARKFHFHNPFGKVARGKSQFLVYEIDQFLNAKNGLTINGEVQNTKMPWLVNDFVSVIKALTTGQQGTLDQATWDSWTVGKDAWFNPSEPIDLIVYVGSLADPHISDSAYGVYIDRWEEHFKRSPSGALTRLKNSVAPLIEANCRIGFDAACVAAGPIPGKNIPFERQCIELQKGWWSFWKWINNKIGKDRVYIESHPFKTNGEANPYLGWNVISDDDWSTSLCCPAEPNGLGGPHMTSEMGDVEFIRSLWQGAPTRTPFISRTDSTGAEIQERYYFLKDAPAAVEVKSEYNEFIEKRLSSPNCCSSGHNYYWYDLYGAIIAYHLIEKQNIRGEINPDKNITRNSILVPNSILQILPESFSGDERHKHQFGNKFKSSVDFINYIKLLLDMKQKSSSELYSPYINI